MEAATARTAPARPAPRRKPRQRPKGSASARVQPKTGRASASPAARPRIILAGAAMLPHAAARSVGAVRDISDSGLIVRLTRGRGWIAVLGALLGGIVALNVLSLSLTAGSGRESLQIDALKTEVSSLTAQIDERLSAAKVEMAASSLGMANPNPSTITYLDAADGDARKLAHLLSTDSFLTLPSQPSSYPAPGASYAPVSPVTPPSSTASPSATAAPATTTPTPTAPTATTPPPTSSAPSGTTSGTSTSGTSGSGTSSGSASGSTGGVGL